jgi:hypothetical protein
LLLIFISYFSFQSHFELLFQFSFSVVLQSAKILRDNFPKICLSSDQAQRLGPNIFNSAYFFIKRKGLAQTFSIPPIFSSSAKVWRKHFQFRLFFHQAQRFGANIFNSAYFFIKRKGLAETFSESAKNFPVKSFPSLPKLFFSLFHYQKKRCKKSSVMSVQK